MADEVAAAQRGRGTLSERKLKLDEVITELDQRLRELENDPRHARKPGAA